MLLPLVADGFCEDLSLFVDPSCCVPRGTLHNRLRLSSFAISDAAVGLPSRSPYILGRIPGQIVVRDWTTALTPG